MIIGTLVKSWVSVRESTSHFDKIVSLVRSRQCFVNDCIFKRPVEIVSLLHESVVSCGWRLETSHNLLYSSWTLVLARICLLSSVPKICTPFKDFTRLRAT